MFAIFCHENEIQRWKRSERWKYIHISSCRVQNNKEANYSKTKHYKPNKVTGKAILRKKNLEKLLLGKTQSCTPEEVGAHPWHEGCDSCQQGFQGKAHILRVLMPPARKLKGWSCSYSFWDFSFSPQQWLKFSGYLNTTTFNSTKNILQHSLSSTPQIFSTDLDTFWPVPSSSIPTSSWVEFSTTMGQELLPEPVSTRPPCFGG